MIPQYEIIRSLEKEIATKSNVLPGKSMDRKPGRSTVYRVQKESTGLGD